MAASRPTYETEGDRSSEQEIIDIFAAFIEATPKKMPGHYPEIDFAMIRNNRVVGLAEVKDRTGWKPEYKTVFLSMSKGMALFWYHLLGIPAVYVVRIAGMVHYTLINDRLKNMKPEWRGRTDRSDWEDIEPC